MERKRRQGIVTPQNIPNKIIQNLMESEDESPVADI
jgi:hypothetical protein